MFGILAGLAICTKQSIGVTLAFIVVILKAINIKEKKDWKEFFKCACYRIIGILIPVVILFMYLLITKSLKDFIDYAILGIKDFSNTVFYSELLNHKKIEIKVLSYIMPIGILLMTIKIIIMQFRKKRIDMQSLLIILLYSLSIIIVIYPISDEIHFLIGSIISFIGLIYLLYLIGVSIAKKINFENKFKIYKYISLVVWVVVFTVILKNSAKNIYNYIKEEKNTEIKHYYGIEISDILLDRIKSIDSFIQEKQVDNNILILDAQAVAYKIPLNCYDKNYDMFLKGNIGKDGEEGIIKDLENKKNNNDNILILIKRADMEPNWQVPGKVIKYVRENYEKVEEVSIFDVYK